MLTGYRQIIDLLPPPHCFGHRWHVLHFHGLCIHLSLTFLAFSSPAIFFVRHWLFLYFSRLHFPILNIIKQKISDTVLSKVSFLTEEVSKLVIFARHTKITSPC